MADTPLFDLDVEGQWRLAHDKHQWILQRRDGRRTWRSVSFVGSNKSTLWRIFREKGIRLTDDAITKVDALPDTFFRFLRNHDPALAKRHPIYLAQQALKKAHTANSRPVEQPSACDPDIEPDGDSDRAAEFAVVGSRGGGDEQ